MTFLRVPIFKSDEVCQFLIDALNEVRQKRTFKLVAYVLMPDHAHLIVNPLHCDIELIGKEIKGVSAKKIPDWLKENEHITSLEKLKLRKAGKRNHSYSVWQKKVKSVDLWSQKFVLQKRNYIHQNPVRAGLCAHPAEWKWSSYLAYVRPNADNVPIQPDRRYYWTDQEIAVATAERLDAAAVEDRSLNDDEDTRKS